MNNVLMNFLLPVFMILPFLFGGGQSPDGPPSLTMLKSMLSELVSGSDKGFAGYIMAGFFGLLVFTAGTNGITETAISREGSNAYFMKIIPMSYRKQLAAKVVTGVILSLSGAILITAAAAVLMSPPLWLLLLCIAVIPGAVLLPNVSGIIFDLYMPKIKWDNEQKAVKQNLNVVFGILGSMLLAAVIAVPVIALKPDFMLAVLYITDFPLILTVLCGFFVNRIATRCMLQLAA
jgi:ABC-2 type transport system permease protein